jgi:hypothetical protein
MRSSLASLAFLTASVIASPGCGGGNTLWVTGKLLKGGTQYAPSKDQLVTITFIALGGQDPSGKTVQGGEPYQAEYDPASGTFSVPGPDGRGIPPGKYRVAVTQKLERSAYDAAKPKITDKAAKKAFTRDADTLKDRFGLTTSPIVVEVNRSQDVTIDLDRPTDPSKS